MFPTEPRLPLWLKLLYTGFLSVLVPIYWRDYGPTNFLYFCDVALFFTLGAIWLESSLLASVPLVGILLPQSLWIIDFCAEAVGLHLTGLTGYMFQEHRPLFTRMLSFFHFWLPLLLLYLVWRVGYDRRAFVVWTLIAWVLMGICYVAMPAPPGPTIQPGEQHIPVNINYVYGLDDAGPQRWMPADWYFTGVMAIMPMVIFLPTHLLLWTLFGKKTTTPNAWASST